jgi:hypothetical protein
LGRSNKEQRETVRDYVNYTRLISRAQISIKDKEEENQRMQEYINMEKEKLEEARRMLENDEAMVTHVVERSGEE